MRKTEPKLKGWTYRNARQFKAYTIAYFNRTHLASKYCDKCQRDHDKDNTLAVRFTAKKYEIVCLKYKKC